MDETICRTGVVIEIFFQSNICSKLSEVNFASCIKTIYFSLFLSKFFDAIFHEILFRCSCKITLNRISINIPIARGRTRSASIRSIDSCARD